ncbi:hypothetical protein HDV05_006832 [Chytridiales sp. JEL 0842]|nr:hypothetical protein HDV05_006832 [Chytridiales sp. JEL 0842]
MRNQHESFLSIAGRVAAVHDAINTQREAFLTYRKKSFGDTRNPFTGVHGAKKSEGCTPLSEVATNLTPSVQIPQQQQQPLGGASSFMPGNSTSQFGGLSFSRR